MMGAPSTDAAGTLRFVRLPFPRPPRNLPLALLVLVAAGLVVLAIIGPWLEPQSVLERALITDRLQAPNWPQHPLGTDALGRDVFAEVVRGARWSISIGLVSTGIGAVVGTVIGTFAAWKGGVLEAVLMRGVDTAVSFPFMVLAVAVIAILHQGFVPLMVTLALGSWVIFARASYAEVLQLSRRSSIEAARALGAGDARILRRYIWPGMRPSLIVIASFTFADLIIAESGLSFLGLGAPPGTSSWGVMLADGRGYMQTAWWLTVGPGAAIAVTVLVANLLGDALEQTIGSGR